METTIIILLLIGIAYELYCIYNELRHTNDLFQRTWQGLFNDPHGGLGQLNYLQYIHSWLERTEKKKEENKS